MPRVLRLAVLGFGCATSLASAVFSQTPQPGMWRPGVPSTPQSRECPPNVSYTWDQSKALNSTTFNGADSAHNYFCGNGCKAGNDNPCQWTGYPSGCCTKQPDSKGCMSYGSFYGGSGTYPSSAMENVEIRGWITSHGGPGPCDSEWQANILLDVDWTPTNTSVWALNSVDRIAMWLPPTNLTTWAPQLTSSGYGGYMAPTIHIEIDGWGKFRSGGDWTAQVPKGWTFKMFALDNCNNSDQTAGTFIYYPFPLGTVDQNYQLTSYNFDVGDYVRAVGTLWLDNDHVANSQSACWEAAAGVHPLGWLELHPVDFMDRLCPPVPLGNQSSWHTVAGYAMCLGPGSSGSVAVNDSFSIATNTYANASAVMSGPYHPPSYDWLATRIYGSGQPTMNSNGLFSFWAGIAASPVYGLMFEWYDMQNTCSGACACASGYVNSSGQCVCAPLSASAACGGASCGPAPDGCGGTLICGMCSSGYTCGKCEEGQCGRSATPCP
jgi:hypothetical protein